MNTNLNNNFLQQTLFQAQLNIQNLLAEFALGEGFLIDIKTAFGNNYKQSILEQTAQQWLESNFEDFPEVEVRSQSELNGANGAFSADTNKIYISREFLAGNDLNAIANLLLEEYGHYIDSRINFSDAPGDEGAIFSALVRGEELSNSQLQQLRNKDDSAVVILDDDSITIEQSISTINNLIFYWTDAQGNFHPVRSAVVEIYDADTGESFGSTVTGDDGSISFEFDDSSGTQNIQFKVITINSTLPMAGKYAVVQPFAGSETSKTLKDYAVNKPTTYESTLDKAYSVVAEVDVQTLLTSSVDDPKGIWISNDTEAKQAFSIFDALYVGDLYYEKITGLTSFSSKPLNVIFPNPGTYQLTDTEYISLDLDQSWDWDVILHEYGHFLAYEFKLDDPEVNGDHDFGVSNITGLMDDSGKTVIPAYGKDYGIRLAWTEGLATYISLAAQDISKNQNKLPQVLSLGNTDSTHNNSYSDYYLDQTNQVQGFKVEIENKEISTQGEGDELAVSSILWDLADSKQDNFSNNFKDEISIGHQELFNIFLEIRNQEIDNNQALDQLEDIWHYLGNNPEKLMLPDSLSNYAKVAKLGAIFEEYDISPTIYDEDANGNGIFDPGEDTNGNGEFDSGLEGFFVDSDQSFSLGAAIPALRWEKSNNNANDQFKVLIFDNDFSELILETNIITSTSDFSEIGVIWGDNFVEWQPQEKSSLNQPSSTPLFEDKWNNRIANTPGTYHIVITGSDWIEDSTGIAYSESEQTGAYWSAAYPFYIEDESEVDLTALASGLDSYLSALNEKVVTEVGSFNLPLTGALGDIATDATNGGSTFGELNFLESLKDQIKATLEQVGAPTPDNIKQALTTALNSYLKDPILVDVSNPSDVKFNLTLDKLGDANFFSRSIDNDLGISGLGLTVEGDANLGLGYELNLSFGIDQTNGFYIDTSASDELQVYLTGELANFNTTGKLGFLDMNISDNPDDYSNFESTFTIDLQDTDNKLQGSEISTSTNIEQFVDVDIDGNTDLNLILETNFADNINFPSISSEFSLDWSLADLNNPQVSFENVKLDLGNFLSNFTRPVLEKVQTVTEPVQPILDILQKEIRLGNASLTLWDIAKVLGDIDEKDEDFIESIFQLTSLINAIPNDSNIKLNLGGFKLENVLASDFNASSVNVDSLDVFEAKLYKEQLKDTNEGTFITSLETLPGGGLEFPILSDSFEVFKLLLGQDANLFTYDLPKLNFDASYTQKFPIFPAISALIKGDFGATFDFSFGYDTQGIADYSTSGEVDDISNGFYVSDRVNPDGTGDDKPEVSLNVGLAAGAAVDVIAAEAGVTGGIYGNIKFDLNDTDNDGKVRLNESTCLFETSGEVTAGARAYVKVGWGWFSKTKHFDSPRVTLASYDLHECSENAVKHTLATDTGNSIQLHTGKNAIAQLGVDLPGSGGGNGGVVIPQVDSEVVRQWGRQYGSSESDQVLDVSLDKFGYLVYVTGITSVDDGVKAWVAEYDYNGERLEIYNLGFFENQVTDATVDPDGNVYLTGNSEITIAVGGRTGVVINPDGSVSSSRGIDGSVNIATQDVFVAKYQFGEQLWRQDIDVAATISQTTGITVDDAGNVYITGRTDGHLDGNNAGSEDPWVAKYNSNGEQQWIRQPGTNLSDSSIDVTVDNEGNVYIISGEWGDTSGFVTKYNSQGVLQWQVDIEQLGNIAVDEAGNVYAESSLSGGVDLIKLDSNGQLVWNKSFTEQNSVYVSELSVDDSGNIHLSGYSKQEDGNENAWIAKFDTNGNSLWSHELGTTDYDSANNLAFDDSGNIYAAGMTNSALFGVHQGNSDAWVAKFVEPTVSGTYYSFAFTQSTVAEGNSKGLFFFDSGFSNSEITSENNGIEIGGEIVVNDDLLEAEDLGTVTGIYKYKDRVDSSNQNDYYHFSVNKPSKLGILLDNLSQDADIELFSEDENGIITLKASSLRTGTESELIDFNIDKPGIYLLRVYGYDGAETDYDLTLAVINQDEFFQVTRSNDDIIVSRDMDAMGNPIVDQTITAGDSIEIKADGGLGNDTFVVDASINNPIRFKGGVGNDQIQGGAGGDSLEGGDGEDELNGGEGIDTLDGNDGDDLLEGGIGADILDGGDGSDTASYMKATAPVTVDLTSGSNLGEAEGDIFNSIENLAGSNQDDLLIGDDQNNNLNGWDGNDTLDGGSGDDVLIGGIGADSLSGGDGSDTAAYISSSVGVSVNLLTAFASGGEAEGDIFNSIENLAGSDFDDLLVGDDSNNELEGSQGDDQLIGGKGFDKLFGGDGNDTLKGSNPDVFDSGSGEVDVLEGGEGADTFVIGDSFERYYLGAGYAWIKDFNIDEGDKILVYGNTSDYSYQVAGSSIDLVYNDDIIASIDNALSLDVADALFV